MFFVCHTQYLNTKPIHEPASASSLKDVHADPLGWIYFLCDPCPSGWVYLKDFHNQRMSPIHPLGQEQKFPNISRLAATRRRCHRDQLQSWWSRENYFSNHFYFEISRSGAQENLAHTFPRWTASKTCLLRPSRRGAPHDRFAELRIRCCKVMCEISHRDIAHEHIRTHKACTHDSDRRPAEMTSQKSRTRMCQQPGEDCGLRKREPLPSFALP